MDHEPMFAVMVLGKQAPQVIRDNYQDAQNEAVRLCKKERMTTYVLKVVACFEHQEIVVTKFEDVFNLKNRKDD